MSSPARRAGSRRSLEDAIAIGIDTGGTFTDFVLTGPGGARTLKVLSTPADPSRAILSGLERLGANRPNATIVHGSTVATNALLQRKGGPAALVTTAGFEDVIEIGRQARASLYDWNAAGTEPIVPRRLRFGVDERNYAARAGRRQGGGAKRSQTRREPDEAGLRALGRRLVALGVRGVAVCFLHSYRDGRSEEAAGRVFDSLGLHVTLSHRLVREYREVPRFLTACANAYLHPVMTRYLKKLSSGTRARLRVLKSAGLTAPVEAVSEEPVHTVLSGPAGGVLAARALARRHSLERVIAFDMGGTSTDAALIDGELPFTVESSIGGIPVHVPAIAVESVGAGGGSIARRDDGGALRVGPESAGADPGPACYGRGTLPTVTDANVMLGRIGAGELLGGEMELDRDRARAVLDRLGTELGLDVFGCARGIIDIANANMERALRAVSLQRGHDPRRFALVSYGGAGGLHACALSESLGIGTIVLPPSPGTFSAQGMVEAEAGRDASRTVLLGAGVTGKKASRAKARSGFAPEVERNYREMERDLAGTLQREGIARSSLSFDRAADLRYRGQSHEIAVPGHGNLVRSFERAYRLLYGATLPATEVEIVTLRVRGRQARPARSRRRVARARSARRARPDGSSTVVRAKRGIATPFYRRERLGAGSFLAGPARIVEYSSTTFVESGWRARVAADLTIVLERRTARAGGAGRR